MFHCSPNSPSTNIMISNMNLANECKFKIILERKIRAKKSAINAEKHKWYTEDTVAKISKRGGYWTLCAIRRQQLRLYYISDIESSMKEKEKERRKNTFLFYIIFECLLISLFPLLWSTRNAQRTKTHLHTSNPNGIRRYPIIFNHSDRKSKSMMYIHEMWDADQYWLVLTSFWLKYT